MQHSFFACFNFGAVHPQVSAHPSGDYLLIGFCQWLDFKFEVGFF